MQNLSLTLAISISILTQKSSKNIFSIDMQLQIYFVNCKNHLLKWKIKTLKDSYSQQQYDQVISSAQKYGQVIECLIPVVKKKWRIQLIQNQIKQFCRKIQKCHITKISMDVDWLSTLYQQEIQYFCLKIIKQVSRCHRFVTCLNFQKISFDETSILTLKQSQWKFINNIGLKETILSRKCISLLTELKLSYLQRISLHNNKITSDEFRILTQSKLSLLRSLSIRGNKLENKGIKYLSKADWPNIDSIFLTDVQISTQALKYLKKWKYLKKTQVVFDFGRNPPLKVYKLLPTLCANVRVQEFDLKTQYITQRAQLKNNNQSVKHQSFNQVIQIMHGQHEENSGPRYNFQYLNEPRSIKYVIIKVNQHLFCQLCQTQYMEFQQSSQ